MKTQAGVAMHAKGLNWGNYHLQIDYDYTPQVHPFEKASGGRHILRRILRDVKRIGGTITRLDKFKASFLGIESEKKDVDCEQPY